MAIIMSAPASFAVLPVAVPAIMMGLSVLEVAAVLSSRDACTRFLKALASSDVREVSSVWRPVGPGEVESLHEEMFGTGEDVSLRIISTDFHTVMGLHARHVICVDEGSRGATRLDTMTTEVQVRLTSAGWRVEGFTPLTGGRWTHAPS
jgi:hypothetical protein